MKPADRDRILALDNNRCQHPGCRNTAMKIDPHHIRYRGRQGGDDSPANCITLCLEHHDTAHNGCKIDGYWQSGRQYVLWLLTEHYMDTPYRWHKVRQWLKDREQLHRVGEKV